MSTPEPPRRPPAPPTRPTEPLQPVPPRQPSPPGYEYERPPPGPPGRGPWWENPWPAILIGIIALLIGGGVGYAIGRNSEERAGPTVTNTVTNTTTAEQPKTVTNTVTASTVKETTAPANQANEERRREAEANLRKVEKENQELKKQLEEVGRTP
jgi:hypothetical protein